MRESSKNENCTPCRKQPSPWDLISLQNNKSRHQFLKRKGDQVQVDIPDDCLKHCSEAQSNELCPFVLGHTPMTPNIYSRREFLGSAAALSALTISGCATDGHGGRPFFQAHDLAIGLQLYTIDAEAQADLEGTLKAVAGMGIRAVELAGFFGRTPDALRGILDRAGLACPSAHIPARPLGDALEGDLAKVVADAHALGLKYIVVPIYRMPERYTAPNAGEEFRSFLIRVGNAMTLDDWKAHADFLNQKAAILKKEGLALGYHNHNVEFVRHGSKTALDILLENTDPNLVCFEMDVGWVAAAGGDPFELLRRHHGRFRLMHVKDIKASTVSNTLLNQDPTEVGSGHLDWKAILPAAYRSGVRHFFIEQEPPFPGTRLDSVRKSCEYLKQLVA